MTTGYTESIIRHKAKKYDIEYCDRYGMIYSILKVSYENNMSFVLKPVMLSVCGSHPELKYITTVMQEYGTIVPVDCNTAKDEMMSFMRSHGLRGRYSLMRWHRLCERLMPIYKITPKGEKYMEILSEMYGILPYLKGVNDEKEERARAKSNSIKTQL